jgi:NAD(P)H-hydrate epimerase
MVAARHLAVAGAKVRVLLAHPPERLAPVTARQHEILRRMGLTIQVYGTALGPADLILDGLLGYSQIGPPSGRTAQLIKASAGRRVLALDVPSGLELSTGRLHRPHVVAAATLTLAAPKTGLRAPGAAGAVGALYLADISVPPVVWARLGLALPSPFGTHTIARIDAERGGPMDKETS